jgi:hypothetical protein
MGVTRRTLFGREVLISDEKIKKKSRKSKRPGEKQNDYFSTQP